MLTHMAPPARLELTTLRLGGARSILVSYGGISTQFTSIYSNQKPGLCQENIMIFLSIFHKKCRNSFPLFRHFIIILYYFSSSIRISSGNAVSNLTPYQCAGFAAVFSIHFKVNAAAIPAASQSGFPCINAPVKLAANISPVP